MITDFHLCCDGRPAKWSDFEEAIATSSLVKKLLTNLSTMTRSEWHTSMALG